MVVGVVEGYLGLCSDGGEGNQENKDVVTESESVILCIELHLRVAAFAAPK